MMMYLYFILYILAGFIITLSLLFWALKNGQFRDQKRARFLPLAGEHEEDAPTCSRDS